MAQHARPHWYTHTEYERPRLNRAVSGFGSRPFSTMPMVTSRLDPPENALAPGVHQPEQQDEDEHTHLHETEAGIGLELCGPGKDEHRFDVEHHEQQGEQVVADLAL